MFGQRERLAADLPQCVLKQGRLAGTDPGGNTFVDLRPPLHGNLFHLYTAGQQFLIDHARLPGEIVMTDGGAAREDQPTYPPEAFREAMANALRHRDYSSAAGTVTLRLFDDRFEIFSAGDLHFGLTPQKLFTHHDSHRWNPLIADVLYYRRIIDAVGTGISRMQNAMTSAGLPPPEIEDTGGSVLVTLRASEVGGSETDVVIDELAVLLQLADEHGRSNIKQAVTALNSLLLFLMPLTLTLMLLTPLTPITAKNR